MARPLQKPWPAATLIIVRDTEDGQAIEVLMTERHGNLSFAAGALVFPGGQVEEGTVLRTCRRAVKAPAGRTRSRSPIA